MDQLQYSILLHCLPQKARASHPLLLNLRNALGSIVFGCSNSKHRSLAGVAQENDGSALGFCASKILGHGLRARQSCARPASQIALAGRRTHRVLRGLHRPGTLGGCQGALTRQIPQKRTFSGVVFLCHPGFRLRCFLFRLRPALCRRAGLFQKHKEH